MPPPPQPFEIPCDCGEHLSGWRTDTHQRVNCTICDRTILVLPTNVYPPVKRGPTIPADKPAKTKVHPEQKFSRAGSRTPSGSRKGKPQNRTASSSAATPLAANKTDDTRASPPSEDRIDLSPMLQQGRTRRRSLRLVIASIVALVAVTGYSVRHRAQRERAQTAIPAATEAGLAALRSGNFPVAVRELTIAAQGVDTLRRTDAAAATIRQAHREAVAANDLLLDDFGELAKAVVSGLGTFEERRQRFQADYGTKWILFDVGAVRVGDPSVFELDVPLQAGEQALQVQFDFPALRRIAGEATAQAPVRVIFAAQVDDWELPLSGSKAIIAKLKPSNAFLWSDYDSYLAVGYHPEEPESQADQETRSLLLQQRQLEVAP